MRSFGFAQDDAIEVEHCGLDLHRIYSGHTSFQAKILETTSILDNKGQTVNLYHIHICRYLKLAD